ncbi:hypothetical protein ES705_06370 [subsurface metagenome]|jgi:tRNA(fMet)-specific endonuclease VapC
MATLETVCIDTDIIIDYLKGNQYKHILFILVKKYNCVVTPITVFNLLHWTKEASKESAKIYAELIKKGKRIEMRDALIAGICVSQKVSIVTRNIKHFQRIKDLHTINGASLTKTK